MALKVSGKRVFMFKNGNETKTLADPNPAMNPNEVMDFYANHHSELLNGTVVGPELGENDEILYHFSFEPKTKG